MHLVIEGSKPSNRGRLLAGFATFWLASAIMIGAGAAAEPPKHGAVKAPAGHGAAVPAARAPVAIRGAAAVHAAVPAARAAADGAGHWAYEGPIGPEFWGQLSADYQLCAAGQTQSPIDIAGGDGAADIAIEFDYHLTPLRIVHNGHTVQVNYAPGSGITVGDERFELLQFHFHTPSEHSVGGKRAAMEMHFVHKNAAGELAVIGVLMDSGGDNPALREVWANMPMQESPEQVFEQVLVNARDMLPADTGFYRYMGSLTTPPCSEGVNWYFMAQPIDVGLAQVSQFAEATGENARPIQALNNRLLMAPMAAD